MRKYNLLKKITDELKDQEVKKKIKFILMMMSFKIEIKL